MTLPLTKVYSSMKFHFNHFSGIKVMARTRIWTDRRTDGQTDGRTDGQTDGHEQTYSPHTVTGGGLINSIFAHANFTS